MIHAEKKPQNIAFGAVEIGQQCWITVNGHDVATVKRTPADARDVSDNGWRPMLPTEMVTVFV